MTENKMYSQRVKNVPVMRYCGFGCSYCAFQKFQKISSCPKCRVGENHSHLEVLNRTPPKTTPDEFVTVGLSGDVSFMPREDFQKVLDYCESWIDTTFLIQSKNPEYFVKFLQANPESFIAENTIIGTTIESNLELWYKGTPAHYSFISQAPPPFDRWKAMLKIESRRAITIEPILDFFDVGFAKAIIDCKPEFVYIGYCNDGKQGKRLRLPEPPLEKTQVLIQKLRKAGIEVREKTMRKAWYE